MNDKILILDFGSQYTQLIARSIRELNVYCEIQPCTKPVDFGDTSIKGVILSGSPFSVNDPKAPKPDVAGIAAYVPVLGVCYGAQLIAQQSGGEVGKSTHREYGRAHLQQVMHQPLMSTISDGSQVWMSHSDTIKKLADGFEVIATTESIPVAAFKAPDGYSKNVVYGIQFHPEVTHSTDGRQLLKNFVVDVCGCLQNWTPAAFISETVAHIKAVAGGKKSSDGTEWWRGLHGCCNAH